MKIACGHIEYRSAVHFFYPFGVFVQSVALSAYTLATLAPLFFSSVPKMWIVGLAMGLGWIVAQMFYAMAFASLWCFFAALASILIYFIVSKSLNR